MSELEPILKKKLIGNQQIPSEVLKTWSPLNNRAKPSPRYVYK